MLGVITRRQVLAHPLAIYRGFGARVLMRALTSRRDETFLDVINRCAEEEAHHDLADVDFAPTVERFQGFEVRARELYWTLANQQQALDAATFFRALAAQEESHAVLLAHVRREARRGRCWKRSQREYQRELVAVDHLLSHLEAEAREPVGLARALEMVEELEGSELDVVFDTLCHSVDRRSLLRLRRFFAVSEEHRAFCARRIDALRDAHGISAPGPAPDGW
ncbi:MAG: hypothetical protein QM765_45390 [Myxococcales bacterium]